MKEQPTETYRQFMNIGQKTGISGIIGKAATNEEFRNRFIANPASVGEEFGLSKDQIDKLSSIDKKNLSAALVELNASLRPIIEEEGHSSAGHSSHGHSSHPSLQ